MSCDYRQKIILHCSKNATLLRPALQLSASGTDGELSGALMYGSAPSHAPSLRRFDLLMQLAAQHQAPGDVGRLQRRAFGRGMGRKIARNANPDLSAGDFAPLSPTSVILFKGVLRSLRKYQTPNATTDGYANALIKLATALMNDAFHSGLGA